MQAPSAQQIESAADQLLQRKVPEFISNSQRAELIAFGDARAKAIGASGVTRDFIIAYELGLQTGRTVLAMSGALVQAGIHAEDLL
ncbi:MAG TPA: hypothetical protein VND65_18080 [Candidatus Binatia bacterium]|nr:hypothetical protein [Candidatus Binatia bacterium]